MTRKRMSGRRRSGLAGGTCGREAGRLAAMTPVKAWLLAEFLLLYVGLPLVMALALPASWLWPLFLTAVAMTLVLLAATPGFAWSELARGGGRMPWAEVAVVAAATAAVTAGLVWWLMPGQALALPRRAPELWLAIMVLYPLLSALPQELVFRVLFFRRYGRLFPDDASAAVANALVFALAHLMFWNLPALALTFAGGFVFARAYLGPGGFPAAVVMHALCGAIVFTSGLGSLFYHGAAALR